MKKEWYTLTTAEKIDAVLKLQEEYTPDQINELFDVRTKRVIPDFMNARGYSKQKHAYVPKDAAEVAVRAPKTVVSKKTTNTSLIVKDDLIDETTLKNIIDLSQKADKLTEIIQWYDTMNTNTNTAQAQPETVIEVIDTSMPIPKLDGEVKRTTIRVNETILSEFNELWRSKYSQYKQHDLLALALQLFIDKYK